MAVGRTAGAELDTVAAVDTAIAALPLPVLFATDIDGTLSEIVEVPDDARLLPGALDALWFLSLSGRVVADSPAVGHRRTAEDVGRIAENPISEDWLHEAS